MVVIITMSYDDSDIGDVGGSNLKKIGEKTKTIK